MAHKKYSDDELIEYIQTRAKELGRRPIMRDMVYPEYSVYFKRFGSWSNAMKLAGFDENYNRKPIKYTKENILNKIKERYIELGKVPAINQVKIPSNVIYNSFGSYQNALKKLGLLEEYIQKQRK